MTKILDFKIRFWNLVCLLIPSDNHDAASGHVIHSHWEYSNQHIQYGFTLEHKPVTGFLKIREI